MKDSVCSSEVTIIWKRVDGGVENGGADFTGVRHLKKRVLLVPPCEIKEAIGSEPRRHRLEDYIKRGEADDAVGGDGLV